MQDSRRRSSGAARAAAGNAVASTLPATCLSRCQRAARTWWPQRSLGVRSDRGTGRGAAVGSGHQDAQRKIPDSGSPDGAGQGGRVDVPGVPTRTLAQDLEYQPAGAAEQRDQAPHPRRRHLPQRRRNHPAGGCASVGAARGMATRWSPHVFRTLDGQAGQHQQSDQRSTKSCHNGSCLITTLRSGHRPLDLHHSKGRNPTANCWRWCSALSTPHGNGVDRGLTVA
jgi:hypothetical protein